MWASLEEPFLGGNRVSSELRRVGIYIELKKKSEREEDEVDMLIGNMKEIISDAKILLNRVSDTYPEYTLHDKTHSFNVLKLMDRIIPKETLEKMNELELTILILSAFLHDIGMVVSKQEKKKTVQSEDFRRFKEKYPKVNRSLKEAQEEGNHEIASQMENQLLTFYLRETHADRGAKFIKKKFRAKLKYRGLDFSDILCKVCRSHGESWEKLGVRKGRVHGYPLREEYPTAHSFPGLDVNVQYLAIILRLADILDFDRERTPSILFEYLYPISEISLKHWLTHLSVKGWLITKDKIKYRVECEHPLYQSAVYDFLDKVDAELQGTRLLVERFPSNIAETYTLHLPMAVDRSEIGPKLVDGKPSYIYGDFQFGLDYDRVIALLSEELHYDESVAIRELLQNSVDACKYRLALETALGTDWDKRNVKIHLRYDSKTQMLIVEDNGIGMDREIAEKHFLRVGCSYFSKDNPRYLHDIAMFKDKKVTFYPISKFGIGILSCFMLTDQIEVRTRRKEQDYPCEPLSIRINPKLKMYVMRELESSDWSSGEESGTVITLHLDSPIDLREALEEYAINLEFDVSLTVDGMTKKVKPRGFGLKCFPKIKKKIDDYLKKGQLMSHAIDLSESKIEGVRGKLILLLPSLRGKLLVKGLDYEREEHIGIDRTVLRNWPKALTTSQGIYVPSSIGIHLPFNHLSVIDFFGDRRPEVTLDRRSFKSSIVSMEKRLHNFASATLRRAICNGSVSFYSPFWKSLWAVDRNLQDFFLKDRKARNELFELPLLFEGKLMSISYQEIRERFPKGISIVFQRHGVTTESTFGNFSMRPPELPLIAIPPNYDGDKLEHFWKNLFVWSELTLVEDGDYYYLKVQLKDSVNLILEKIVDKLPRRYVFEYYPVFARYKGITSNTFYSNNFALAFNLSHPLVRLFLSCLDKANADRELALMRTFESLLKQASTGRSVIDMGMPLGRKLRKHGLVSYDEAKLFKTSHLHVRDINEMTHLFLEPLPAVYRFGWMGH